ncbi:MAG: HD domain-containing protein [Candidatus Heimdallarchaeota archaeon]
MEWDELSDSEVDDQIEEISNEFFFGKDEKAWEKWSYRHPRKKDKPIFINHPVLGTIRVEFDERLLLNSKPLQRIKYISQMGMGHMTYPGASHSRFVHSIGVMDIATTMANRVQTEMSIDEKYLKKIVRYTALLHDIAHGPYSHLSEYLYTFQTKLWVASAHEKLAAKLLNTEAGKKFLEKVGIDEELFQKIPLTIQGDYEPKDKPELILGAHIINGDMDADKLEYISTDSHFAGLNLPTDLNRLLTQIKYKETEKSDFDLFVDEKGARSFHIILRAKELLYPTVYHHHTTCGFEGLMLCGVLSAIQDDFKKGNAEFNTTLDLLKFNDWELLNKLKTSDSPIANDSYKRIYNRYHYRVAYDFRPWFFVRKDDKVLNRKFDELVWEKFVPTREVKIEIQKRPFKGQSLFHKKEIIKKTGINIKKKFPTLSREKVSEDDLIDYAIYINYPIPMETKPYKESRVLVNIAEKERTFSLVELGYPCPQDMALHTFRIMTLPEIRSEVTKVLSDEYNKLYT